MKVLNRPMEPRMQQHRERFQKHLQNEIKAQKMIDLVMTRPIVYLWPKGTIKVDVSNSFWSNCPYITFHLDQIELESFIDGILGPLHRKKGYIWSLDFEGDEADPVFVYTPTYESCPEGDCRICFRVKEGEFKSCKVKRIVKDVKYNSYPTEDVVYEMECM